MGDDPDRADHLHRRCERLWQVDAAARGWPSKPRAGVVLLDGESIHRLSTKVVATRIGILPQSPSPARRGASARPCGRQWATPGRWSWVARADAASPTPAWRTNPTTPKGSRTSTPSSARTSRRFPRVPGERYYCSTCCFRDAADVEARQVYWADLLAAKTARVARERA